MTREQNQTIQTLQNELGDDDIQAFVLWSTDTSSLSYLLEPDLVLRNIKEDFRIKIEYPVSNGPFYFPLRLKMETYKKKDIVQQIRNAYFRMYEEEEETSTTPVGQLNEHCINRNFTNGKYGIWGHNLTDLILEDFEIDEHAKTITPGVSS